jgi:hypothetical protein
VEFVGEGDGVEEPSTYIDAEHHQAGFRGHGASMAAAWEASPGDDELLR